MSARPRQPKLPPLFRFQVDYYILKEKYWTVFASVYETKAEAIDGLTSRDFGEKSSVRGTKAIIIRRLRDGKIVYRNKAARAAGIGGASGE